MEKEKTARELIEEACDEFCTKFCKYADTVDENCECEYMRKGGKCPLFKLS